MTDVPKGLPDIASIQAERLITCRVSEDRFSAEVLLPGLWYTDFDKGIGGKWALWSVTKVVEAIRAITITRGFVYQERFSDEGHFFFLASAVYSLSKEANSIRGKTHWGRNFPLYAILKVYFVGKSSFSFRIHMQNYKTGVEICTARVTSVFVDFRSRTPLPLPAWFMEKFVENHDISYSFSPRRLPVLECPPNAFEYKITTQFSDIDVYGHVNQSVYVRWCTDAGAEAAARGFYRDFKQDIGVYDIETVEVSYVGEGMFGEEFLVLTWQDDVLPKTIHFIITKLGKPAFVGRFSFRNEPPKTSRL